MSSLPTAFTILHRIVEPGHQHHLARHRGLPAQPERAVVGESQGDSRSAAGRDRMTDSSDMVAEGRQAWQRLRQRATWADWLAVGRALLISRTEALKAAGTNRCVGTRYIAGDWLRQNGLDDIAAQERYRLMLILEHLPAIEQWRGGLPESEQRKFQSSQQRLVALEACDRRTLAAASPACRQGRKTKTRISARDLYSGQHVATRGGHRSRTPIQRLHHDRTLRDKTEFQCNADLAADACASR